MKTVEVEVPVSTAYNQWTQFESFPNFMAGVQRVEQITDTRTHWQTTIGGVTREFDAEITEQHPDERVAWRTDDGVHQAGVVTFHRLDDITTRVTLQMDYQPESFTEKVADWLGAVERRTMKDLENFKRFIEARGAETGAWRGEVPRPPQSGQHQSGEQAASRPAEPPPMSGQPGPGITGPAGGTEPIDPTLGRIDRPPA